VEIHPEKNEIVGYNPVHRIYQGWGEPAGFSGYFVAVFDTPFSGFGTWNDSTVTASSKSSQGRKTAVGAYVQFAQKAGRVVRVKIGTSCTSLAGARKNLQAEIPGWNLAQVKAKRGPGLERGAGQGAGQGRHGGRQSAVLHGIVPRQHPAAHLQRCRRRLPGLCRRLYHPPGEGLRLLRRLFAVGHLPGRTSPADHPGADPHRAT
jgi:hypothetical protein